MKKAVKTIGVILLGAAVLAAAVIFVLSNILRSALGENREDYYNLFTMQTPTEGLPPLEDVEQRTVDVRYITKAGTVETRPIRLYLPEQA